MKLMDVREPSQVDLIRQISLHQPAILAYILSMHPNRSDASDILQETNVVLWQKLSLFQAGTNFKAWAFRIAYLQTLAHLKRRKRGRWLGFSSDLVETLAAEAAPILHDFEERHSALRGCIEKLPEIDRNILTAHYECELPLTAVSERVGRTVGALKQVLLRVRRSLQVCVERQIAGAATPMRDDA